jgi:hypothetical protein
LHPKPHGGHALAVLVAASTLTFRKLTLVNGMLDSSLCGVASQYHLIVEAQFGARGCSQTRLDRSVCGTNCNK